MSERSTQCHRRHQWYQQRSVSARMDEDEEEEERKGHGIEAADRVRAKERQSNVCVWVNKT